MDMKKHIGIIRNVGTRIIVVYREIPNDENHCLVVETDRLPDYLSQQINDLVNSLEASGTNNFYEVLHRRMTSDGENFLLALHTRKLLKKVKVADVLLYPRPGQSLELSVLNSTLKGTTDTPAEESLSDVANPALANTVTVKEGEDPVLVAQGLIKQAELLEAEANMKRRQAEAIAPGTDVKKKAGRPSKTEAEKEEQKKRHYQKELERTRKVRAEKKEAKQAAEVNALVSKMTGKE